MKQIDQTSTMGIATEAVQDAKKRFGIIGNAPALLGAVSRALQVAPIDLSVLVTGESGSGKEFFPKIIHAYSARKHGKYIAVNCGAIPEGTIDSELFGHEKGSFTGAVAARRGYFEEADGGTIFLDEVAELPLTTQARLLRVLETGEYLRVGSSEARRTNLRVVAATNVDLVKAVAQGRFREDLYYRLSTVQIAVPPLRDRGNDIILLARNFAAKFAEAQQTTLIEFDDSARSALLAYRWPGNVRQLKNVIDQMALFLAGRKLNYADVEAYLPHDALTSVPMRVAANHSGAHEYERERELLLNMVMGLRQEIDSLRNEIDTLKSGVKHIEPLLTPYSEDSSVDPRVSNNAETAVPVSLEDSERDVIRRALARNNGNRRDTAAQLNISERTLYRKIKELNITN